MAIPDISNLTLSELSELAAEIQIAYKNSLATQEIQIAEVVSEVNASITSLSDLLGTIDGTPDLDSIRGILQYTDQQMAENSGLAFRLSFQGLEMLTNSVLNLSYIISKLATNLVK